MRDANAHVEYIQYDAQKSYLPDAVRLGTESDAPVLGSYAWDNRGNPVSLTNGENETTAYTYNDITGDLTAVTDARGYAQSYLYDVMGRRTREHHPNGRLSLTTYDALGQVTAVRDYETISDTDAMDPTYTPPANSLLRHTGYEYDSNGNRTAVIEYGETTERRTLYEYDALNRVTKIIYPDDIPANLADNDFTARTYDVQGRLATETGTDDVQTTYSYDAAGPGA